LTSSGNILTPPVFWDVTKTDHLLPPGSLCIDAGSGANDPDGSTNDIGFTGGDSPWFDTDYDGMPDLWENYYGLDYLNPTDATLTTTE